MVRFNWGESGLTSRHPCMACQGEYNSGMILLACRCSINLTGFACVGKRDYGLHGTRIS